MENKTEGKRFLKIIEITEISCVIGKLSFTIERVFISDLKFGRNEHVGTTGRKLYLTFWEASGAFLYSIKPWEEGLQQAAGDQTSDTHIDE